MAPRDLRLLGVVLCGGKSRRMGDDKARLETDAGDTFLDHAYQRLSKICSHVYVSVSPERTVPYPRIVDPPLAKGPITGIEACLRFADQHHYDACLVTPIDTPALSPDDLHKLVSAFAEDRSQTICAVSNGEVQQLQPLIAVYPVSLCALLQQSIDRREYSLMRFLDSLHVRRVELSPAACQNINTRSEFQTYRSQT